MGTYSCRPTPLTFADNLTARFGGAQIYIKREDLNHTDAHKVNNVMGQGLLAKRMGKRCVIAETGAGQHGVAAATMAAKLGFECTGGGRGRRRGRLGAKSPSAAPDARDNPGIGFSSAQK